ncbi:hypothetical protein GSY69_04315 [Brevibacterium sp. 5221]|uniref:Uncharacterized protein n=1 Tax=Brevibacterium rongguiense TaxID=2695267 RepID=A0A6N9H6N8_9MICO|nr:MULTISPECIES: hypothetical protein [Brevibacterium]MYM19212.1 hypothetical protein [Brevibacterium rongguiense]WAL39202.1 hypothetical protein BRM1_07800 [Brevibacterium sp. BRM-1]
MMTPVVPVVLTKREACRELAELRERIGDVGALRERGERFELSADELVDYGRLLDLEFLTSD